ncbi:dTDP-4-dehydrorhamnose reductase [Gordonia phthalatica]|uniref:dTDP-4-dehydrorhamnose reductase n=1 Tax=Gordonia phthalatica TaxID=1136941 RepID=A0A0N7FUG3_9ACTN|nr:dTDP-4-dehydrorhamnose reductase [Gordonia phthalatica]ALG84279.1 dTDP-4-dehydrorhamnose reductase [Gordonia phthalatica]
MNGQRFFVVGAGGQLGGHLLDTAGDRSIVALTSRDIDVTDGGSVARALAGLSAGDVVVNASAYTAVDAAETDRDVAYAVNENGPRHLAAATRAAGARLIHVSTDYVFAEPMLDENGAPRPFEPTDPTGSPATVYGASKLAGERAARTADPTTVVVRTAWVFTGRRGSSDFVATMIRLEDERDTLRVVDDQTGSPTYARDLAAGLWELADVLDTDPLRTGAVLHATNAQTATWHGLARAVFAELDADPARVLPCTTDEFPRPAPRPSYSVLSARSWADVGLTPLRTWRDALHAALTARSDDRPDLR